MKISSGRLKGKKIFFPSVPKLPGLKPTEGIVKEALISILRPYLSEMVFLDLFAGSGAVGFEVYSNGAKEVVFVEKDKKIAQSIEATRNRWEVPGKVFVNDYRHCLDYFHRHQITFDAVFVDPPYHRLSYFKVFQKMNIPVLLKSEGWVILERHYRSDPPNSTELESTHLNSYCLRKYGSVCLDFYRVSP